MDISSFGQSAVNQVLPSAGLDTVRALHQTIVSLRAALENSQTELSQLRDKIQSRTEYRDAIEKLSIENHILRRKIITTEQQEADNDLGANGSDTFMEAPSHSTKSERHRGGVRSPNENTEAAGDDNTAAVRDVSVTGNEYPTNGGDGGGQASSSSRVSRPQAAGVKDINLNIEKDVENLSLKSLSEGENSMFSDLGAPVRTAESENESEEVDDIELIFTTDETKDIGAQEDLVSITETGKWRRENSADTPVLLNFKTVDFDAEDLNGDGDNSDDDVFETQTTRIPPLAAADSKCNLAPATDIRHQKSTESTDSCVDSSYENRSLEKDESFDQFDEREKRLQKMWSQCSVLVETDISKCGVLEDADMPNLASRRNTCPNPLAYRPIIHRDAIGKTPNRGYCSKFSARNPRTATHGIGAVRPILNEKNSPKTESEAQTDISALPCPWKSESYLAHKVSHNFTTLPSKFALPISQQPKIRLSEKTQEARRVLLSDINFTSMVPELSRSADHLCQDGVENNPPHYTTYTRGPFLRTPEVPRKYDLADSLTSPNFGRYYSPSDYSNFGSSRMDGSSQYMNRYRGSLTSINSPSQYEFSGRGGSMSSSYWRQNCPASFDSSSCRGPSFSSRPTFGSVPTSPTRHHRSRSVPHVQRSVESGFTALGGSKYHFGRSHSRPASQWGFGQRSKTRSRVTFEDTSLRLNSRTNHSLPDLRSDSYDSGGDSTDSLVEEAEHYLRRSIDCMVSGGAVVGPVGYACESWKTERNRARRASAPDPVRETDPPAGSTPYLPRIARDLRPGHWVKVIGPEGRVRGGRVRHVGPIIEPPSQTQSVPREQSYVGVELATPTGNSDGSYQGRRFFDCDADHAIFVPFKKVIMAWST